MHTPTAARKGTHHVATTPHDVDVTKSPGDFESVVLGGERCDPESHALLVSDYADWANTSLGRTDLFVYRHTGTGNIFLAVWLHRPTAHDGRGGVFATLEELKGGVPGHASCAWEPDLHWLRLRLRPWGEHHRDMIAAATEKRYREQLTRNADVESRLRFAKYLRSKGKSETAILYERGFIPWAASEEM